MSVEVSYLVNVAVQKCYAELDEIAQTLPADDAGRKRRLYEFFQKQRLLFIRLIVLLKWCEGSADVKKCHAIQEQLHNQSLSYFHSAVTLGNFHNQLWQKRTPSFAVPTAVDVLVSGSYTRFPKLGNEIWKGVQGIESAEQLATFSKLNNLIRLRLSYSKVPRGLQNLQVGDGRVRLTIARVGEVVLTLFGPHLSDPWRVLTVELLTHPAENGKDRKTRQTDSALGDISYHFGPSLSGTPTPTSGSVSVESVDTVSNAPVVRSKDSSAVPTVTEKHLNYLVHELQLQMNTLPANPLGVIYDITCFFALSTQLVYLQEQARVLMDGPWAGLVRVNYQPGIKLSILYWGDIPSTPQKSRGGGGVTDSRCSNIEIALPVSNEDDIKPGNRLVITHTPPLTETTLTADDMYVDDAHSLIHIERLFNTAVYLHVRKRLLDLKEVLLSKHAHFFSADNPSQDVYVAPGPALHIHYDRDNTKEPYAISLQTDSRTGTWQVKDLSAIFRDCQSRNLLSTITARLNSSDIFVSLPSVLVLLKQELALLGVKAVARDMGLDVFQNLPTLVPLKLPTQSLTNHSMNERSSTSRAVGATKAGPSISLSIQRESDSVFGMDSVHPSERVIFVRVYGTPHHRYCAFRINEDFSLEAFDVSANALKVSNSVLQIDRVSPVSVESPRDVKPTDKLQAHTTSNPYAHVHPGTRITRHSKRETEQLEVWPDKRIRMSDEQSSLTHTTASKCAFRSEKSVRTAINTIRVVAELSELCDHITSNDMEYIILANHVRYSTSVPKDTGITCATIGHSGAHKRTNMSTFDNADDLSDVVLHLVRLPTVEMSGTSGITVDAEINASSQQHSTHSSTHSTEPSASAAVCEALTKYNSILNSQIQSVVIRPVHNDIPMAETDTNSHDGILPQRTSWQVEIVLSSTLVKVNRGRAGGGHVAFDPTCNVLFMRYADRTPASFARFRVDWERFVMASVLCLQYTHAMATLTPTHPLRSSFHVSTFDFNSIRVRYTRDKNAYLTNTSSTANIYQKPGDAEQDRCVELAMTVQWVSLTKKYLVVFGGEAANPHAPVTPFMEQQLNQTCDFLLLLSHIFNSRALLNSISTIEYPRTYLLGPDADHTLSIDKFEFNTIAPSDMNLSIPTEPFGKEAMKTFGLPSRCRVPVQVIPRGWNKVLLVFGLSKHAILASATREEVVVLETVNSGRAVAGDAVNVSEGMSVTRSSPYRFEPLPFLIQVVNAIVGQTKSCSSDKLDDRNNDTNMKDDETGKFLEAESLNQKPSYTQPAIVAIPNSKCDVVFGALAEYVGALTVVDLLRKFTPKNKDVVFLNATISRVEMSTGEGAVTVSITSSGSLYVAFEGIADEVLAPWLQQMVTTCHHSAGPYTSSFAATCAVFDSFFTIVTMPKDDRETFIKLLGLQTLSKIDPDIKSLLVVPAVMPQTLRATAHLPRPGTCAILYDNSGLIKFIVRVISKATLSCVDVAIAFNTKDMVLSGWEKTVAIDKPGGSAGLAALFGSAPEESSVVPTCPASAVLEAIHKRLKAEITREGASVGVGASGGMGADLSVNSAEKIDNYKRFEVKSVSPFQLKWCVRELLNAEFQSLVYNAVSAPVAVSTT
eukprot:CFRG2533T1